MTKNIKNEIMSEIRSGKLSMRSRWIYLAQKIGLESGFALTLLVLVFFTNLFLYYIRANNLFTSIHDGSSFLQELLHSLPYDLILLIILLFLLLNFIIKKFKFSYKSPFIIISLMLTGIVIFGAIMLFISNFNGNLQNSIKGNNYYIPYVSHFYMNRCPMNNY